MLDLITSGLISEAIENAGINESDTLKIIQIPKLPSMMDSIILYLQSPLSPLKLKKLRLSFLTFYISLIINLILCKFRKFDVYQKVALILEKF